MKSKFAEGQEIYLKARVDRAPAENTKLYRLVTEKGTVVWASEEEILDRADFISAAKEK
ncbi:MAG: hypothetical protein ACOX8B_00080 [Lachnospiraceae bacterium]|jgi:hypothetical protein